MACAWGWVTWDGTRRMGNGWEMDGTDGWDGMGWAGAGIAQVSWEWHRVGILPSVMREPSAALLCQSACLLDSDIVTSLRGCQLQLPPPELKQCSAESTEAANDHSSFILRSSLRQDRGTQPSRSYHPGTNTLGR